MAVGIRVVCSQCRIVFRIESDVPPGGTMSCLCGAELIIPEPGEVATALGQATLAGSSDDRLVTLPLAASESPTNLMPDDVAEALLRASDSGSGRYVEQGVIAQGGMGEIVLCIDRDIRRPIALKRMLTATADDPSRRARFIEEAQVTGQLEHPNIVPVHELTRRDDGSVYFTMKLVKGKSLADILHTVGAGPRARPLPCDAMPESGQAQGPAPTEEPSPHTPSPQFSLSDLLQIFLKVCDGVAFAHSRGVLHRDLKPANIMVGDFGEVLVMDWGLAKVKGREDVATTRVAPTNLFVGGPKEKATGTPANEFAGATPGADRVFTSRVEKESTRTIEGSMIGTPAYMPPEQAEGKLDQIDERSDIYSLGAILYEMLALERAIQGETQMAVILNVVKGNIVAPEQRAPGRTIPRELSAIAMKCLSKLRGRRYRSVLDLKRDISLFLEGRSVSASPDSFRQAVVKLVKRNKGISASVGAAAAIIIVLTTAFIVRLQGALNRALASENVAVKERKLAQEARDAQRATALSASERFAKQAIGAAEWNRWDEAEQRARDAEAVCLDGPWGLYARASFARIKKDYERSRDLLQRAVAIDSKNTDLAKALKESEGFVKDLETAKNLVTGSGAADWQALERLAEKMMEAERWREAAGTFARAIESMEKTTSLPPDQKAQPKERLAHRLGEAKAWIACEGFYDSIKKLPAEEQVRRVEAKLSEVSGQAVKLKADIKDGKWLGADLAGQPVRHLVPLKGIALSILNLHECGQVRDLSPLRGMPLTSLVCFHTGVSDLSPLKGMPLTSLGCRLTAVSDLSPLKGMPLTTLICGDTKVRDLSSLKGMPLTTLECDLTQVSDLSPLKGMPLTSLHCNNTKVSDLSPLKGMPLTSLDCNNTQVSDLGPLKGMPLTTLWCSNPQVSDLRPLEGMKLESFTFTPKSITKGIELVRGMKTMREIGDDVNRRISPEAFWKKYDAGEFK